MRSDRERAIIIGGYTPPMFQAWNGQEPSAAYIETLEEPFKTIITGSAKWRWRQQFRTLATPRASEF